MPKSEKLALFIDGANLYATAKTLGFDIDYRRLLAEYKSQGALLRGLDGIVPPAETRDEEE